MSPAASLGARRRLAGVALAGAALAGAMLCASCGRGSGSEKPDRRPSAPAPLEAGPETREALLLFVSPEADVLRAERREFPWSPSMEERAAGVARELLRGPTGDLLPAFPPGWKLRELWVTRDGTAIVDFDGASRSAATGSTGELLAIAALVDTLALNFPEIHRVSLLLDGEETESLFGHVDTRFPLKPDARFLQGALEDRLRAAVAAAEPAHP